MKFTFAYTGLRVRNLDAAIGFFTNVLGMTLKGRVNVHWNKGEFANLVSPNGNHRFELSWYAPDSPVAGPFREGDELDHLGFEVDDFDGALERLAEAGYRPSLGPFHEEGWHLAYIPTIEGIWLDVFHADRQGKVNRKAKQSPTSKVKKRRTR